MTTRTCPRCGTVLLPSFTVCPFCHAPVGLAPNPPLAPTPPMAPSPGLAPSPDQVCPSCNVNLGRSEPLQIPRAEGPPRVLEAYVCPNCGRVQLYDLSSPTE